MNSPRQGDCDREFSILFTVFTSAYQAADTIHRPFESLRRQVSQDFEWVVVDMGTDQTDVLVRAWQEEGCSFPIRYYRLPNTGKHGAINFGVQKALGRLFIILDADDECIPEALERLNHYWDSIPEDTKEHYAGIGVLCRDQNGDLVGSKFPLDVMDTDFLDLWHSHKVRGEKWLAIRTEVMREFPFPEMPDFRSIPESVILFRMARKYQIRWVNEILRIYWVHPQSISRKLDPSVIAGPVSLLHLVRLNEQLDWFFRAPIFYSKSAIHYSRFCFHRGLSLRAQVRDLKNSWAKVLWGIMLPVGYLTFLRDTRVLNR
ncbi:MAG: glycosyltransferase family 2 protein [Desulfomonilaceae bacterium]|nr:glycosyltransferase family 2 protein [Desulfomonilaceae bacterium]